ncbi:MAG: proteasome accessory factor PafA2 family protein [Bowdeniella nasicola]|nr:proteasome accessory factor PafA2 family protein [Bowdeniella nasicola]
MSPASAGEPIPGLGRVVGIETEYGITSAWTAPATSGEVRQAPLNVEDAVKEIFRHTPQRHRAAHHFLRNGGRLYVDIGSHPEIAGPECLHLDDLLAQDQAGDLILARMLRIANQHLPERIPGARIHLLKSNADSYGNTFGCHENYQFRRDVNLPMGGFVSFLAARQILIGAGALPGGNLSGHTQPLTDTTTRPLQAMLYSARAEFMKASASADPTHERAFVNTRDEPHADKSRWRRLHVIAGDSAMSEATTAVKVVLGAGVLDQIENHGWDLADIELVDPVAATNAWNLDPLTPMARKRGSDITCPELLEIALEKVAQVQRGDDEMAARALDVARRGITALQTGDHSLVATELDWAIKFEILSHIAAQSPQGWMSPKVLRTELAFHDISPATGLSARLRKAGLMQTWSTPEAILAATDTPPRDTRAQVRGAFVTAVEETNRVASVGWAHVRLDRPARPQVDLPEPLQATSEQADALIAEIYELGLAGEAPPPPRPAPIDAPGWRR